MAVSDGTRGSAIERKGLPRCWGVLAGGCPSRLGIRAVGVLSTGQRSISLARHHSRSHIRWNAAKHWNNCRESPAWMSEPIMPKEDMCDAPRQVIIVVGVFGLAWAPLEFILPSENAARSGSYVRRGPQQAKRHTTSDGSSGGNTSSWCIWLVGGGGRIPYYFSRATSDSETKSDPGSWPRRGTGLIFDSGLQPFFVSISSSAPASEAQNITG